MDKLVERKDRFYRQIDKAETPMEFMDQLLLLSESREWFKSEGYSYKGAEIARDVSLYIARCIETAKQKRQYHKVKQFELVDEVAGHIKWKYYDDQAKYRAEQVCDYESATLITI